MLIRAGGSLTVEGRILAQQLSTTAIGGSIDLRAGGDLTTVALSEISASGSAGGGGEIDFTAMGRVSLGDALSVVGADGGSIDVTAGADLVASRLEASANGQFGGGGDISLVANTGIQISGPSHADGALGGCGGPSASTPASATWS